VPMRTIVAFLPPVMAASQTAIAGALSVSGVGVDVAGALADFAHNDTIAR
jgi:hypothetical protein